jgi:hypothetical protein
MLKSHSFPLTMPVRLQLGVTTIQRTAFTCLTLEFGISSTIAKTEVIESDIIGGSTDGTALE